MAKGNSKILLLKCIEALRIFKEENKILRIAYAYRCLQVNNAITTQENKGGKIHFLNLNNIKYCILHSKPTVCHYF